MTRALTTADRAALAAGGNVPLTRRERLSVTLTGLSIFALPFLPGGMWA